MANAANNRLGALWVNEPKSEKGPVLTGEIAGQRVVGFKNKRWSESDQKQPLYQVYKATTKKSEVKASA